MKKMYNVDKEERKLLNRMIWRSGLLQGSFNMVRMQGFGYLYSLLPAIEHYYKDDKEKQIAAMQRSSSFYNSNIPFSTFVMGLNIAMEKQKSENYESIDDQTITSLKTSLMGPLAGIGDSFMFNTVRIIAAGIGVSLATQGNIFGPLLFLAIYLATFYLIKINFAYLGYTMGDSFIDKLFQGGLLKKVTQAASIIGIVMVGALVSQMVDVKILSEVKFGESVISFQSIFDSILPGLLGLLIVLGCRTCIKKGVKPLVLVLAIMLLCVLFAALGVV